MLTVLLAVEDRLLRGSIAIHLGAAGHAIVLVDRPLAVLAETNRTAWDVAIVDGGTLGREVILVLAGLPVAGRPVIGVGFEDPRLSDCLPLPLDAGTIAASITAVRPLLLLSDRRVARANGREVSLTRSEYRLLSLLLAGRRREVSIAEAMEALWGSSRGSGTPAPLRSHVRNLRLKLGQIGLPDALRSRRGRGYVLAIG